MGTAPKEYDGFFNDLGSAVAIRAMAVGAAVAIWAQQAVETDSLAGMA